MLRAEPQPAAGVRIDDDLLRGLAARLIEADRR